MLLPSSGSTLKRGGALSEKLSTQKTARCYNAEDCNLGWVLSYNFTLTWPF